MWGLYIHITVYRGPNMYASVSASSVCCIFPVELHISIRLGDFSRPELPTPSVQGLC